ncbi:hypothetical protein J6590_081270 [Homalodisca vitripennis]|nr:hypothetical protein J6590_081270 [Homalodisca vitripennis]
MHSHVYSRCTSACTATCTLTAHQHAQPRVLSLHISMHNHVFSHCISACTATCTLTAHQHAQPRVLSLQISMHSHVYSHCTSASTATCTLTAHQHAQSRVLSLHTGLELQILFTLQQRLRQYSISQNPLRTSHLCPNYCPQSPIDLLELNVYIGDNNSHFQSERGSKKIRICEIHVERGGSGRVGIEITLEIRL